MRIYRAYYGWFDCYQHIGTFKCPEDAWIACYKYYKEHLCYEICWECFPKDLPEFCNCKTHRLRSSRYTRCNIREEDLL